MKQKPVTFNHNPVLEGRLPAWRPRFVLLSLLMAFMALAGRVVYLQVVRDDFLQAKGESRYLREIEIPATRGRILDRNGNALAVSTPVRSIWVNPEDVNASPADIRKLASLLNVDVRDINTKLDSDKDFVYLKRQIPPELASQVEAMNLQGIHIQTEYRRYYPKGEVMAHILGFTGVDDHGQEGVELAFDKRLTGQSGMRRVIRDRRGQVVEDRDVVRPPREGEEILLSVDDKIQYIVSSVLRDTVINNKAKGGGAVALDVKTGEVLALANYPTFNPNNRVGLTGGQLRNRALTDTYEPGSTMKPFIITHALEKGKVKPSTQFDVAGSLTIHDATISDAHHYGVLTVQQIVQKSSNIGTAKIASLFKPEEMWELYNSLGFGLRPGLGFPGEASGRMRAAKTWRPIEQATMSYGHGIAVSLFQMAQAYLALARDGDMVKPSLLKVDAPQVEGKRIYSEKAAREMRAMLETVTQAGGTATMAHISGYRVAGKTGTAMKLEGGRYVEKYVSSFVGFAPASNPRLVIAVAIDEPEGGRYYGGSVAGPAFASMMEGALRTLGVAPDAPLDPPPAEKPVAAPPPPKPNTPVSAKTTTTAKPLTAVSQKPVPRPAPKPVASGGGA